MKNITSTAYVVGNYRLSTENLFNLFFDGETF